MASHKGLGKGLGVLFGGGKQGIEEKKQVNQVLTDLKPVKEKKVKDSSKTSRIKTEIKTKTKLEEDTKPESLTKEHYQYLSLKDIEPNPYQPRKQFNDESLLELSESIKHSGLIQPLIVRPQGNGKYLIIAGERRYRASKLAGLQEVPAIIKKIDDRNLLKEALIENIQREDLNILDEALALKALKEEHGFTQEMLSEVTGKPRSSIANTLRILSLSKFIQEALKEKQISFGHAKVLMTLESEEEQEKVAQDILKYAFSVRQTEDYLEKLRQAKPYKVRKQEAVSEMTDEWKVYVKDLEERFIQRLNTKVQVQAKNKGGEIKIFYYSNEELSNLLEKLDIRL